MNNPTNDPNDTIKETVNESTQKQWKDIGKISGIYKIVNKVNGKYYVGSTKNFDVRWKIKHRKHLRGNCHYNDHLQKAWNKYGETSFEFQIVEFVKEEDLFLIEQRYLDIAENEMEKCYNLKFSATGLRRFSQYSLEKLKRTLNSKEVKEKMRLSARNRPRRIGMKMPQSGKLKIGIKAKLRLCRPENNPNFDSTIYNFINNKTSEQFSGTRSDFRLKMNVSENVERHIVTQLKKSGRYVTSYSGWRLNPS